MVSDSRSDCCAEFCLIDLVSSITWLENNLFLVVHTPTVFDTDSAPASTFNLVTRQPPSSFGFQQLADPSPPFGLNRSPPHHFVLRLKDFPPNLQDALVISSTASTDIGLVTRSKSPLTSEVAADKITGVFTSTSIANDSRRAQLPMTEDMSDTSPIGMAFDLSSKTTVLRPIVGEEIEQSPGPLPALTVLNHEGLLAAWWVVYSESIRTGTTYPGLAVSGGASQAQLPTTAQAPAFAKPAQPVPASGGPASAFGTPAQTQPTFGTPSASAGAFGAPSALGANRQSPWGAASNATPGGAFASTPKPVFGSTGLGANGTAFGTSSTTGPQASPWGTPTQSGAGTQFGQTSGLGMRTSGVFGSSAFGGGEAKTTPVNGSSGFGTYASSGGFAAAAASQAGGESIFSKSRDASGASIDSGMVTDTSFGAAAKPATPSGGIFGGSGLAFNLGSSFKGDGTAKDDLPKPANPGSSLFGDGFGSVLGETKVAQPSAPEIQTSTPEPSFSSPVPVPAPAPPKFNFAAPGSVSSDSPIHGDEKAPANEPSPPAPPSPVIKEEPQSDDDKARHDVTRHADAPLPPDTTSKDAYAAGESSVSSVSTNRTVDDAPLPPDFVPAARLQSHLSSDQEQPALPSADPSESDELSDEEEEDEEEEEGDFDERSEESTPIKEEPEDEGLDGEGSGVDVAQDLSPVAHPLSSPTGTPPASLGSSLEKSSLGGSFANVPSFSQPSAPRLLFGEVPGGSNTCLPPPQANPQDSPSPVRTTAPRALGSRPDASRSVSAPNVPGKQLGSQPGRPGPSAQNGSWIANLRAVDENELQDSQDERIQEELATELEGTTKLEPFIAHQDYVGTVNKPGIPGQIERVYRDINSMVDTLGLNARSLQAFLKGHQEQYKDGGRTRDDLEHEDDWTLIEIEDLMWVEKELAEQLDQGRVQDVDSMLDGCAQLRKDLYRGKYPPSTSDTREAAADIEDLVRAKHNEIKKLIDTHTDPEKLAATRAAPLSPEQLTQQHDLRRDYAKFQESLASAEESISLLRAKVASQQGRNGSRAVPTVEAVMKTIQKMTDMIQEKSGDVDVLENQIRKLRIGSVEGTTGREGSPRAAGSSARSTAMRPLHTNGLGRSATPEAFKASSRGSTPRKHMSDVTAEEIQQRESHLDRKRLIAAKVKSALQQGGLRRNRMDD